MEIKSKLNSKLKFFLAILLLIWGESNSQNFINKAIINVPDSLNTFNEVLEARQLLESQVFINVVDYLPLNYVKDGSKDYTKFIQTAIKDNKFIKMPNFPILINDKGLSLESNSILFFDINSSLELLPSNKTNYEILRIHNVENIKVFSPKINGDRDTHIGSKGEWGMGISINSSKNITIVNPYIKNCWGDGLYLGQIGKVVNKDISVSYGIIDNNRRNAVSVISVDGFQLSDIILSNTHGTNPQAGIDFEPNNNTNVLMNIYLKNIYTFNNKNIGVLMVLGHLKGSKQYVDLSIENHFDNFSIKSIGYHNIFSLEKYPNVSKKNGCIQLINVFSENSKYSFFVFANSLKENIVFKSGRNIDDMKILQITNLKI